MSIMISCEGEGSNRNREILLSGLRTLLPPPPSCLLGVAVLCTAFVYVLTSCYFVLTLTQTIVVVSLKITNQFLLLVVGI